MTSARSRVPSQSSTSMSALPSAWCIPRRWRTRTAAAPRSPPPAARTWPAARRASMVTARYASRRDVARVDVASRPAATWTARPGAPGTRWDSCQERRAAPDSGAEPLDHLDADDRPALGAQAGQQAAPAGHALVPSGRVRQADAREPYPRDGGVSTVVAVLDHREV